VFWMLLTDAIILRCLAEEAANLGGIRGSLVHRIGGGDRRHLRRTVTLSSAIAWCQGDWGRSCRLFHQSVQRLQVRADGSRRPPLIHSRCG